MKEHIIATNSLNVKEEFKLSRFLLQWEMILVYLLIVVNVIVMILKPNLYFAKGTIPSMIQAGMDISFMSLGMYVLLGQGDRDISIGGLILLVSMIIGILYGLGIPTALCILGGLAVALLGQLISGFLVTVLNMSAVIVAISMAAIYRGIVKVVLDINTLTTFPDWFQTASWNNVLNERIPISLIAFLICSAISYVIIHKTQFGRQLEIIGVNSVTAKYSGINVTKLRICGYLLMGVMVTISSIFFIGRLGNGITSSAGIGYELEVLVIASLGGVVINDRRPTVVGVVLATLVMSSINYSMSLLGVQANIRKIFTGLILIICVAISQYNRDAFQDFKQTVFLKRKSV